MAPTKVNKYHPDFKPEQLEALKDKKEEPKEEGEEGKEKEAAKGGKEVKSLKDKYVVIDMKNRGKKNFITTVSGLNNFSKENDMQTSMPRTSPKNAAKNSQSPAQQ